MGFEELLKGDKFLIGMCHLPSVEKGIGSWHYSAQRNIDALASAGFKAVILENDGDKELVDNPRYNPNPERLQDVEKHMLDTGSMIRKKYPNLAIGYQVLWNYWGSIRIAHETGGDFIRSQLYWENRATPSGLVLEKTCPRICHFKAQKCPDIAVLADIDSKGTRSVGDYSRELSIAALVTSSYAPQALIFTGNSKNGSKPNRDSFTDFHNEVRKHSSLPVGGGQGLNFGNLEMFTDTPASFWIVGTSLKDGDYISSHKAMELVSLLGK
jgi:predicted TIM-barrel enzyme